MQGIKTRQEKQTKKWENNFTTELFKPCGHRLQKFVNKTPCDECTSPITNRDTFPDRALHTIAANRDNPKRNWQRNCLKHHELTRELIEISSCIKTLSIMKKHHPKANSKRAICPWKKKIMVQRGNKLDSWAKIQHTRFSKKFLHKSSANSFEEDFTLGV